MRKKHRFAKLTTSKSAGGTPSKREIEDRIAYLEGLNNALLKDVPLSVLIVDERFKVIFANRNFYLKTRKTPPMIINKQIEDVFPVSFITGTRLITKIQETIETGVTQESEIRWRGSIYNCKIVPSNNVLRKNEGSILLLDDITQEKYLAEEVRKIERHLTNVVESANDLIFSADTRGWILTWNNAAQSVLGYSLDEVYEKTFYSLCFNSDRPRLRQEFTRLKKKKTRIPFEIIFLTKDGSKVFISWSFGVIRNDQDKTVGFMGVGRDLTDRRRLEAQLIQSAKMASLGTMSSGLAHELRNPLAIASGAAQLLLKKEKAGFIKVCSDKIYSGVKRASDIIENLLRYSHISDVKEKPVAVNVVIDDTLSLVEHRLMLEKIKIVKDYAPSLPQVLFNKNRLQQVFMNLIMNAIDAMKEKKSKRELGLQIQNNDNHSVKVLIKDTGCGIPNRDIPKIFEPFFTTKSADKNTGLGLFIAYGIIKDYKGDITAESEIGKGSTFIITLPAIESLPKAEVRELKEFEDERLLGKNIDGFISKPFDLDRINEIVHPVRKPHHEGN